MIEPYYSKEQADELHRLREAAGGTAFDAAWEELVAAVRADMTSGGGPTTEQAKALGRRWKALVIRFTGGDTEIERMLYEAGDKYYVNNELRGTPVPNVLGYMRRVFEALGA